MRRVRLVTALLVALVLAATATVALVPRHEQVGAVDAVVVLGGGGGERLALGARISEQQGVPLVLSAEAIGHGARAGRTCGAEVVCLRPQPVNTAGEARSVRRLSDEHGWQRVAVATSSYHVNRTRLLFRQCLGDRVDVTGAPAGGALWRNAYRYGRELAAQAAAVTVGRAC